MSVWTCPEARHRAAVFRSISALQRRENTAAEELPRRLSGLPSVRGGTESTRCFHASVLCVERLRQRPLSYAMFCHMRTSYVSHLENEILLGCRKEFTSVESSGQIDFFLRDAYIDGKRTGKLHACDCGASYVVCTQPSQCSGFSKMLLPAQVRIPPVRIRGTLSLHSRHVIKKRSLWFGSSRASQQRNLAITWFYGQLRAYIVPEEQ